MFRFITLAIVLVQSPLHADESHAYAEINQALNKTHRLPIQDQLQLNSKLIGLCRGFLERYSSSNHADDVSEMLETTVQIQRRLMVFAVEAKARPEIARTKLQSLSSDISPEFYEQLKKYVNELE